MWLCWKGCYCLQIIEKENTIVCLIIWYIHFRLGVLPNFDTDFWKNTYYDPPLCAYSGHVLGLDTAEQMFMAETKFKFDPKVSLLKLHLIRW